MQVIFDRVLKTPTMSRGYAVDHSGKRWRGFSSQSTLETVLLRGYLGAVGLCKICRGRVYDGWECIDYQLDICDNCVILPCAERVFVAKPANRQEWSQIRRRFFREKDFEV